MRSSEILEYGGGNTIQRRPRTFRVEIRHEFPIVRAYQEPNPEYVTPGPNGEPEGTPALPPTITADRELSYFTHPITQAAILLAADYYGWVSGRRPRPGLPGRPGGAKEPDLPHYDDELSIPLLPDVGSFIDPTAVRGKTSPVYDITEPQWESLARGTPQPRNPELYYAPVRLPFSQRTVHLPYTAFELALQPRPYAQQVEAYGPVDADGKQAGIHYTHDAYDGRLARSVKPHETAVGSRQRLRIYVPNVNTQVTLGEALGETDDGTPIDKSYAGFGVQTDGHIFMHAKKSARESQMRLQSEGNLSIQTTSAFYAGGRDGMMLGSGQGLTMNGAGGVTIVGGIAWPYGENPRCDARSVEAPDWLKSQESWAAGFGAVMAGWDAAVSGFWKQAELTRRRVGLKPPAAKMDAARAAVTKYGGIVGGFVSLWGGVSGLVNAPGAVKVPGPGGTTVFGKTGLILGSALTTGLYSVAGTAISSIAAVDITAYNAKIETANQLDLTSAHIDIASSGTINIASETGVALTSRTKSALIAGATVYIGSARGASQSETKEVNITAKNMLCAGARHALLDGSESVIVASSKLAGVVAEEVYLTGHAKARIAGEESVDIHGKIVRANAGNTVLMLDGKKAVLGYSDNEFNPSAYASLRERLAQLEKAKDDAHLRTWETISACHEGKATDADYESAVTAQQQAVKAYQELSRAFDRVAAPPNGIEMDRSGIKIRYQGVELSIGPTGSKFGQVLSIMK